MGARSNLFRNKRASQDREGSTSTIQKKCQSRTNPFRNGIPSEKNTKHLTILLDTVGHGKLPEDYQPAGAPPREIIKKPGDILDT
jgi:hypothetical protein